MSNFYTLLTRVGAALHANAQVNQTTVPWTHMRLGDGNGAAVVPTENQTGLVRQVHTLQITDIAVHPDNPNWVIVEAVVPSDVGGWTVRETAIYGGADGNTCIAVGNYPETYKPVLAEGAGREMVMRMVVEISSVATVKLQIDPAVAIASRAWVESLVATPTKAGLVKLANEQEHLDGEIGNKAATPAGVKAMLAQPEQRIDALEDSHRQYEATGEAVLTSTDNKIVFPNIKSHIKLEKGDVVRIKIEAISYDKLHTAESLLNDNEIHVNYEHAGSRGNGPLKLPDYTGPITIKRIAKWHNATEGLGQAWVNVFSIRSFGVEIPNTTGRTIAFGLSSTLVSPSGGKDVQILVDGVVVGYEDVSNASTVATIGGDLQSGSSYMALSTGEKRNWAERR